MKKWNYTALTAACLCGLMAIGAAGCAFAKSPVIEAGSGQAAETEAASETNTEAAADPIIEIEPEEESAPEEFLAETFAIWGPVLWVEDNQISIDNQSGLSSQGEVVLNISPEATYVLDGINGYPVELSEIKKGEVIYAYIGPAMTMSLPPQTFAHAVICQIPQDAAAAQYVTVKDIEQQSDESYILTAADGARYQVPADCQILPYLTRNLVTLSDVHSGSRCLIWSNDGETLDKIVLFAD